MTLPATSRKEERDRIPAADGFLLLHERPDGIYISVFPPIGGGRPVAMGDVRRRLSDFGLSSFDTELVKSVLDRADGIAVKIGTLAEEAPPVVEEEATEGRCEVRISDDGLRAFLNFTPAPGDDPEKSARKIYRTLEEAGVTHGLRRALIEEVAASRVPVHDLIVAEGASPERGDDGRIDYFFDPDPDPAPAEREDGGVDFRERGLIQNVAEGTALVRIVPETPGSPGVRVDGRMILPEAGKAPPPLRPGEGVRLLPDGRTFESVARGHVTVRDGVLRVEQVFVCDDVDYETGNVEMDGAVLVRGTVRAGFTVRATGDVEVRGAIEGAAVVSEKGSVWVHGGIAGGGRGHVIAARDVAAKFIERASVAAGRTVAVDDAILDSEVSAGREVRVGRGVGCRGQVSGGVVRAARKIVARIAGAPAAPATELRIEPMEAPRLYARLSEIERVVEACRSEMERIETLLECYPRETASAERAIAALTASRDELDRRRRVHLAERAGIERRLAGTGSGKIEIEKKVYENVLVVIGRAAFRVKQERGGTDFFREGDVLRWK